MWDSRRSGKARILGLASSRAVARGWWRGRRGHIRPSSGTARGSRGRGEVRRGERGPVSAAHRFALRRARDDTGGGVPRATPPPDASRGREILVRSEEHTSELQSRENLVCRLLLEKKK